MTKTNIRGLLYSLLIGGIMAAGVLLAAPSKATPDQDTQFFAMLEQEGLQVTNPTLARASAYTICNELATGTSWRAIMRELMGEAGWTVEASAALLAISITVYCPDLAPDLDNESNVA